MRVKLVNGRVGQGFAQNPGTEIEVPEDEGQRMIDAGHATAVDEAPAKGKKADDKKS